MKLYDDKFVAQIQKDIIEGKFHSREELLKYLESIPSLTLADSSLMEKVTKEGLEVNTEDLEEISKELLNYYDMSNQDLRSLNMGDVKEVSIDGKDYIKIDKEDGTHIMLDSSMEDKTALEEYQERQMESVNYQTNDGKMNADLITEDLRSSKEEVVLDQSSTISWEDLTEEEKNRLSAFLKTNNIDERNVILDPKRNIYMDKDSGETFYVHENSDGQLEVRKAIENEAHVEATDVDYLDEFGEKTQTTVDNSTYDSFEELSDYDLQYMVDNMADRLDDNQLAAAKNIIEKRRQQQAKEKLEKQSISKPKVLIKEMQKRRFDGFTSIVFLCLITSIYGIIILLYLLINNGLLK